tara:strand:- start:16598 stop:16750 length:153 start_codon:yes stop_codon:yes gene_type:complete
MWQHAALGRAPGPVADDAISLAVCQDLEFHIADQGHPARSRLDWPIKEAP